MPEALAIVAVFAIAAVIYVGAWVQSRDPALTKPAEELARLQQHAAWLEARLAVAQRENWDHEMAGSIAAELSVTHDQLAKAKAGAGLEQAGLVR